MSGIVGVFGSPTPLRDDQVASMISAMAHRGTDRVEVWREEDAVLAVSRYEWETEDSFAGSTLIAQDDRFVVAADISLYYRQQLARELERQGVAPRSTAASDLLLAAFRLWGEKATDHLDGDYAFVVWDRQLKRAVAIREFAGKRPLHYAVLGRELVIASTIQGVIAHPRCPRELNEEIIAGTVAGLILSAGPDTAYSAVRVLPNGFRMGWTVRGVEEASRFWNPPVGQRVSSLKHDEAALHLRELLVTATEARMHPTEPSTVWMSGGWDSTAVFASAQVAARKSGLVLPRPISISYPVGDPGREDELISAVADRWESSVHWLNIADIPFFDREEERAALKDEPYSHLYENWNSALAEGSFATGSRIALDGNGGDQLFQSSDIFLADLFRQGKWISLAREWPARKRGGAKEFFARVVQPNLGPRALKLVEWRLGGRPRHYLERPIPEWMNGGFVSRHDLVNRDLTFLARPLDTSFAEREIDWYFTCLFVSRAFARLSTMALEQGVELRSPLSDRRVIEFALSRPWWERSSGIETKRLLRTAMKGIIPDEVLAPRSHRTGVTSGYSHNAMLTVFPQLIERLKSSPLILEEMGIVRSAPFYEAAKAYADGKDSGTRVGLFYTLQTELWLRSHRRNPQPESVTIDEANLAAAGTDR